MNVDAPAHLDEADALRALAAALGVHTTYTDGLHRPVEVAPETLVRVCAALGAALTRPEDAGEALRALRATGSERWIPPALVAWDGRLAPLLVDGDGPREGELRLEGGATVSLHAAKGELRVGDAIPFGYHRLTLASGNRSETATVIAAPTRAWRRPDAPDGWGVATHLAALRSSRSRSVGDLRDLATVSRWVGGHGGDLLAVLPLLPTFNQVPAEPSPYAPVSRLFWSELILDLGDGHVPVGRPATLDVTRADAEVRRALAGHPLPDRAALDPELLRYAQFRGAQARLGRNWRDWPEEARAGRLSPSDIDPDEERFHLVAQVLATRQLGEVRREMRAHGVRLGLDLAVGVHPDGYDIWSRQTLFAPGMSVGAPPDPGFPSGQDWGFPPVLPEASRAEGHRYLAACIAHQAGVSGVLRVDHIMALTRLYWIPQGFGLHEGTYVNYPPEELFAVLTLESHRARCEVVGENLGTVPAEIREALPRHGIRGMYVAVFAAGPDHPAPPPTADDVAYIGTHDTPMLAGWVAGEDIAERVRCGLLAEEAAPAEREARDRAVALLSESVGASAGELPAFLGAILEWMGRSPSPRVIAWLEDLCLEVQQVNLPGTRSSDRPNWQRPMSRLLDEILDDPEVNEYLTRLQAARSRSGSAP